MKVSEFRKLIREEVQKVLNEGHYTEIATGMSDFKKAKVMHKLLQKDGLKGRLEQSRLFTADLKSIEDYIIQSVETPSYYANTLYMKNTPEGMEKLKQIKREGNQTSPIEKGKDNTLSLRFA